ncbi:SinR family protein [Mycobacteroides abscessus]|uniref:SinR family protein n=1 Tax=Mycobacteroides abscessus TaxID=36809 RepID=A0ABD7HHU6_9MYCO|nr:SinR family protein [Mycobacteroides abscessus]RIT29590.1 SinR family protein [Mycobacteroides abscessus]
MNTILLSYDLNKPGQDYAGLVEKLKSYGTYWHHLDSLWIIKTSDSAVGVRDIITPYLDANDELLVVDITGDSSAWRGFADKGSKWLKDYL